MLVDIINWIWIRLYTYKREAVISKKATPPTTRSATIHHEGTNNKQRWTQSKSNAFYFLCCLCGSQTLVMEYIVNKISGCSRRVSRSKRSEGSCSSLDLHERVNSTQLLAARPTRAIWLDRVEQVYEFFYCFMFNFLFLSESFSFLSFYVSLVIYILPYYIIRQV